MSRDEITLRTFIALLISAAFLVYMIYRFMFRRNARRLDRFQYMQKTYPSAEAIAGKVRHSHGYHFEKQRLLRESDVTVRYDYMVDGRTYHKKLCFANTGEISTDYPYKITVYYPPGHPGKGICTYEVNSNDVGVGCLLSPLASIALLYILVRVFGLV